jgi:hypothetical protein
LPLTGASASLEAYYKDSSIFDLPCVVDSVLNTITFAGTLTQAELIGYFEDTGKDYQYFCSNVDILINGVHAYIPITWYVKDVPVNVPLVDMATQADLSLHTGNTSNPHSVTLAQVGAEAAGTAATAVSNHNQSLSPHSGLFDAAGAASTVAGALQTEITNRGNADSALVTLIDKNSIKTAAIMSGLTYSNYSATSLALTNGLGNVFNAKTFSATVDNFVMFAVSLNPNYSKLRLYYKWALADYVTDTFNKPTTANGRITDFAFYGTDLVFISGLFTTINGENRSYLACWNKSTNALTDFAPVINAKINAMAIAGDMLYIFGAFTTVDGSSRSKAAAFNLTTFTLDDTFNPPTINGTQINSARYANSKVYIGGDFINIGGTAKNYVAALNPTTAALDATFNPVVIATGTAGVTQIEVNPTLTIIYIGGMAITSIGGVNKSLGAVNWDSGALYVTFNTTYGYGALYGMRLNSNSANLWVCGNFAYKHASLNANTGAVSYQVGLSNSYGLANLPVPNGGVILYGRHTGYNCLIKTPQSYFTLMNWVPVTGGDLNRAETYPHGLAIDPVTGYVWAGDTYGLIAVARNSAYHKIVSNTGNLVTALSLMPFNGVEALSNSWTNPVKQTLEPQAAGIVNTSYIEIDKPANLDYAYLKWSRLAATDNDDTNTLALQIFDTWIEEVN